MVSFLVITLNRYNDIDECINSILAQNVENFEIIIVDNGSENAFVNRLDNSYGHNDRIVILHSSTNLGVSGGRNLGLRHAKGSVIITIDDDAVIKDQDLTSKVQKAFNSNPKVGTLAFKIITYSTGNIELGAFPSKNKRKSAEKEFETSWFIGAGHAIKKEVYEDVGNYNDYFPYGHEELDLSLRIIDAGYKILFFPKAEVYHKKSPTSRITNPTKFHALQLSNRIKVAIRNLPWKFVISTGVIRSIQVLVSYTRFNLVAVLFALYKVVKLFPKILNERKVIKPESVKYIRSLKGPVVY